MEVNQLPEEIFYEIYQKLPVQSLMRCRLVCKRWREGVDSLTDQAWKKICQNCSLNEEYAEARNKYGMSWKDTYKSLNSWKSIGSANISGRTLCNNMSYFKVLPGGIVACVQNNSLKNDDFFGDTIAYYDIVSFNKTYEENYDTQFFSFTYDENEYMIVMVQMDYKLCIINKETKEQFTVGIVRTGFGIRLYHLIGKEVYFQDSCDKMMYVSKLKKENGVSTIETKPLGMFPMEDGIHVNKIIIAVCMHKDTLNILTKGTRKTYLFSVFIHENPGFRMIRQLNCYFMPDMYVQLEECGFNWKSIKSVNNRLMLLPGNVGFRMYTHYGNVYLTYFRSKDFLCEIRYLAEPTSGPQNLLESMKSKPIKIISKQEICFYRNYIDLSRCSVRQLEIFETSINHKVLILVNIEQAECALFVFDIGT